MHGTEPASALGASRKWVVIHGHFYQPPRENPWLDLIETQPAATPYHDWNERIYAECYRPNGYSRLLDSKGMITGICNNYRLMSFNFGPTLMAWMEEHHPVTMQRIIAGDRDSALQYQGHGNAIAQVYNHIIMPLASQRDQLTQIRWAKEAYSRSFGRSPEGMWLAETAINMETVRCLIKEKISFVVLAPHQAESFRKIDDPSAWISVKDQAIDTRRPYRLFARNPSGKKEGGFLDIFFFDEQLSKEVSFNGLLQNAHTLGKRIDACFTRSSPNDEVVVIATDGETFGHHKPFGDMCLAYFFAHVAPALGIQVVNFGRYRALHPPEFEVSLKDAFGEGTAWSCAHGVGRWSRDCGCTTGGEPEWNQSWRAPMRAALDNLQEAIDETYAATCNELRLDPWALRDDYSRMFDGFSLKKWDHFLTGRKEQVSLTTDDSQRLRRLLEAQKYMLFAFTSCGWFFSEISGIEAMQNLAFACRALQLGIDPPQQAATMDAFIRDLSEAKSNINGQNGATLFERHILPFFFHERMLCFTVAMENALGITTTAAVQRYGYLCRVQTIEPQRNRLPAANGKNHTRTYTVELDHEAAGERSIWLIVTDLSNPNEPSGWVLPWTWNDTDDPATITPLLIQNHPQAQLFTLADVFSSLRQDLATIYLQKIARRSDKRFASWLQSNEEDLTLLQSFYPAIPDFFHAPLLFILQQKWHAVFSKLETPGEEQSCVAELAALQKRLDHFKKSIDLKQSAACCEKLLTGELEKLTESLNIDRCDRIRYLLNIVDRFSLPVSKHRLEDIFYPILTGAVTDLYHEAVSNEDDKNKIKDRDKRELLIKLLNFARRMNFSIEKFNLL